MPTSASHEIKQPKLVVHRDARSVRCILKRIKHSERLAGYALLGRRNPARMLDYLDRRDRERSRVEMSIYVTPATFDGQHVEPLEDCVGAMIAMTRDASLRGIGFTHEEPLEGDYAIVHLDLKDGDPLSLLLEVRWSNFELDSLYMSGGRFLGIADLPAVSRRTRI